MKLALLNTLSDGRGGGISGDGLSLDLQFAADKTLTARKGPTPVFTRGSTGTFVGSNGLVQSAAVNAARFDHDSAGVCRGLLIEESRTNTLWPSDNFASSQWNASSLRNLTVSADNTTSPSGATDADRLTVGATTTTYSVVQNTITLTSGTVYAYSAFVKANEVTRVSLWAGNTVTLQVDAIFDLTGSGSVVANAFGTASIQSFGNGWFRCIIVGAAGANSSTSLRISPASGTSRNYPGNSVDSFWAWGAQLEAGSFATSYIPTTTGSVVRSADVCSITGANFTSFYNSTEGSLFTSAIFNAPAAHTVIQVSIDINDTTTANRLRFVRNANSGTAGFANTSNSSLNVLLTSASSVQPQTTNKYSAGFKLNDYAFYLNNAQVGTDNLGDMIVSPTTMTIGDASAGQTRSYINGTIAAIRYYRKRLPNAKLQALTA